ncbi:MAG: thiamine pyrophosphate-binding protein [Candidatus Galacturonibacter soehngenii]|nr:thiamine pyrophosphate-binding protein [Candidatus Galacturonibacter soehngenii]
MKIKLSKYIADFLVENGIKDIFTVTGGGAMHLNDAFGHKEGLRCVYNHHEQACAIAAEGYTRLSGNLSAVCVTSGPGGTNAITGVLGGWLDSIPMFIISGQVKRETTIWSTDVPLRQLGDQEFNIVDVAKTMTKYAYMITEPTEIRYHLEKALFLSKSGRPGPVWIDIPLDVQAAIIETDELKGFNEAELCVKENPIYDLSKTQEILERIKQAKRPVILAGTGIRIAGGYEEFLACVDKLGIPVVTAWNAHDLLWKDHPYFCGKPGTLGTRGGNFVVQNSDLLISLGCRMNIRMISYNKFGFAKDAYKIIVDIDENELKKPTIKADMPVHANVRDVMKALAETDYEAANENHKKWLDWCKKTDAKYPATLPQYYDTEKPMNPYAFMTEMFDCFEEGEKIICGNGAACVISFQAGDIKKKQRLFANSGCAAMGYGFPAAIGGAIAQKGERIICIDGDGSFQMNLQELQTVVYNKLNIKIIYLNNNGYHSIRQTQTNLFDSSLVGVCDGNGLSFPEAEKIAYAYGISYVKIDNIKDAKEKVKQVLNSEGPVFCEVVVDPNQNFEPKLSSKVLPDGKIVSPDLDDMFPFLPKEEYEANKNINLI